MVYNTPFTHVYEIFVLSVDLKNQQTPQIVQGRKRGLLVYKQKDVRLSQKHSHDNNNTFQCIKEGTRPLDAAKSGGMQSERNNARFFDPIFSGEERQTSLQRIFNVSHFATVWYSGNNDERVLANASNELLLTHPVTQISLKLERTTMWRKASETCFCSCPTLL